MAEFKEISPNASYVAKTKNWFENRFPTAFEAYDTHMAGYFAPKNFNFWYIFGSLALLVLVIQIVTGIFLVMHYKPDAAKAFESVEYIMRDVPGGWIIRYMHSTGASAFFVVVYLHMFRGLLYGSYRKPRELVWIFGCLIFLCLMAEAFFGYLLPWGQMSYWGAQVIVNLFAAIPFIGPDLALLIRGDYVVGDATLNRFFSFHVIAIPLVLIGLVAAHLLALHDVGSNNPDGIEIKQGPKGNRWSATAPADGVPFHPYYTVHDILAVCGFLFVFCAVVFFAPEMGGYFLEYNNFVPADPLVTPLHIAPVWYFTPFYSMLRGVTSEFATVLGLIAIAAAFFAGRKGLLPKFLKLPALAVAVLVALLLGLLPGLLNWAGSPKVLVNALNSVGGALQGVPFFGTLWDMIWKGIDAKFWGVVAMGGAVVILIFLPWLDKSPAKSIRYRPKWHTYLYAVFVVIFVVLGYLGVQPPSPVGERVSQVGTLFYFGFFLLMPWWSQKGQFKAVPERVTFTPH